MNSNLFSQLDLVIEIENTNSFGNTVNYKKLNNWNGSKEGNVSSIGSNGDPSYYQLYDTSGQVYEWIENSDEIITNQKICRGGCFADTDPISISKNSRKKLDYKKMLSGGFFGFRVASKNNIYGYSNFISVGNINNKPDDCDKQYGKVSYAYYINKYLVTNEEYCDYLNLMDPNGTNHNLLYDPRMKSSIIGGIELISCNDINNKYIAKNNMGNKPVTFISWMMAAKYINWLNNNKSIGSSSLYNGSYILSDELNSTAPSIRQITAEYFLPNENEWYKAAYYDPIADTYYIYGTKSNNIPLAVLANTSGDPINVENNFSYTQTYPITIKKNNILADLALAQSSKNMNNYGYTNTEIGMNLCPKVAMSSTISSMDDNISMVSVKLSGLIPNESYNYSFNSLGSNWSSNIEPISGSFIPSQTDKEINAILKFCPYDQYDQLDCEFNLPYSAEPSFIKNLHNKYAYNILNFDLYSNICSKISSNIKISNSGLPQISRQNNTIFKFLSPNDNNTISISGSLCDEYVPIVAIVSGTKSGTEYDYSFELSNNSTAIVPSSGKVSVGSGFSTIAALLALKGQPDTIIKGTLRHINNIQDINDFLYIKCDKLCETNCNNYANYNGKAIWGICGKYCNDGPFTTRAYASVTTVGLNGGPSYYGTYDQDGNILELCIRNDNHYPIWRGGSFDSNQVGKYVAYIAHQTPSMPRNSIGFRIASINNPLNLSMVDIGDIGSKPTGNYGDISNNMYGRVNYEYKLGTYPVTNNEYAEFLNSIVATGNSNGNNAGEIMSNTVYHPLMSGCYGGIDRLGSGTLANPYRYIVQQDMGDKPVGFINSRMAYRYTNWLHNNKRSDFLASTSGAYSININEALSAQNAEDALIYQGLTIKETCAKYWIPTEDEWYKAAYYKGDGTNSGYWYYATQSNVRPTEIIPDSQGNRVLEGPCSDLPPI